MAGGLGGRGGRVRAEQPPRRPSDPCPPQFPKHPKTKRRLVWSRIWAVLSEYFIAVGCHPNGAVASFAVDALRQLAMRFLERDELANFTFQGDFLRPFVVIMRQSQSVGLREMIIRCVSQARAAAACAVCFRGAAAFCDAARGLLPRPLPLRNPSTSEPITLFLTPKSK